MKKNRMILVLAMILCFSAAASLTQGNEKASRSEFLGYAGKSYTGFEDPEYIKYDMALRTYEAERIKRKFGLALDPKDYTGLDLLEIEALLKFKKSGEAFDPSLKKLSKRP